MLTSRTASVPPSASASSCHDAANVDARGAPLATHCDMEANETRTHQQQEQTVEHQQSQQEKSATAGRMGDGRLSDEATSAATKIQAGFRGYQVRKQIKLKKNGSDDSKIVKRCNNNRRRSSSRRGADSNKPASELEERSATKIQAGIRGFLVRKHQKKDK